MTYYAEFETDKYILENYFQDFVGTMIEIGAGDPIHISMSKAFREKGWRTICVEPDPFNAEKHKIQGNEIYEYAISNFIEKNRDFMINNNGDHLSYTAIEIRYPGYNKNSINVIKRDVVTLDWFLNNIGLNDINFISVDVEGWELEVMQGFNTDKYKPKIILLENLHNNYKYREYMESIGYILDSTVAYNQIYKRNKN